MPYFFEEENINTLEMAGELLLTILSSVAQQESETISLHVKLGLKMKKERGELVGFNNCLGYQYDKKNGTLIIVEKEAEIVRFIFDKYCEGYGAKSIAELLTEMNIKTKHGNEVWRESTIRRILKNEKYKGDILQGKTFTADPITHKRLFNYGEEDMYYITGHHKPIVSVEQFDLVQSILKERCGSRATGRRLGEEAFIDSYKLLCNNEAFDIDSFLDNMKEVLMDNTPEGQIEKLEDEKKKIKYKQDRILELLVEKTIDETQYQKKIDYYAKKIEKVEKKIEQLQLIIEDDKSIKNGIAKFRELIKDNNIIETFDNEIFDALVDYVIIGGYDENGNKDEFLIRFILKRSINLTPKSDIERSSIVNSNKLESDNKSVVLDFLNSKRINVFERDEKGKIRKKIKNGIRVRVEYCDE